MKVFHPRVYLAEILSSNVSPGVIGLTTAIKILEDKGAEYNVTIIAETFPTDPRTIKYTSFWAVSFKS